MNIKRVSLAIGFLTLLITNSVQAMIFQFNGTLDLYQNTDIIASESVTGRFSFIGEAYNSDFTGEFVGVLLELPVTGNLTIPNNRPPVNPVPSPFELTWNGQTFAGDLLLDVNVISLDLFQIISLDNDGDGIPGLTIDVGPNGTSSVALSGEFVATVPVPAAFWLFGSGLFALTGYVRLNRKKSV